jgi:predicted peroxiredoxin
MANTDNNSKLVLLVSHGANDDKSTVAFTIANAALSTGMEVGVFLTSDAVELSREGAVDFTHVKPFKKLEELIDGFLENGGQVWTCSPCFNHRGLSTDEVVERAIVTGAGPMLEWIQAGAATVSL